MCIQLFILALCQSDAFYTFVIRTLCEKYREGNKPLDMVFVDLEKAYDTVPRVVLWRCMRKRNIPEGYMRLVQDMYQGATTRVKSKRGISEQFEVGIGLHQGSALSPFLFIMLVDTISQDVRTDLPWELLYADDLAIIDITSTDTQNRLESWQNVLTDNGLKINVAKTEHLSTRESPLPMNVNGDELIPPSHRRRDDTAVLARHKPQWHRHGRRGSAVVPSLIVVAPRKLSKRGPSRCHGGNFEYVPPCLRSTSPVTPEARCYGGACTA